MRCLRPWMLSSLIVCIATCSVARSAEQLTLDEAVDVLRVCSKSMQANRQRIKTWAGRLDQRLEYRVASAEGANGNSYRISERPVSFVVDVERSGLFAECDSSDLKARRIVRAKDCLYFLWNTTSSSEFTEQPVRMAFREAAPGDARLRRNLDVFNPMDLFGDGQELFEKRFEKYAGHPQRFLADRLQVQATNEEPGSRRFEIQFRYTGTRLSAPLFVTWEVDEHAAFNVIHSRARYVHEGRETLVHQCRWTYLGEQDVVLPKEVIQTNYDSEGRIEWERTIRILESRLNQPVEDDQFTYRALQLKNGDHYRDKLEKKEYVYQNAKLVLAETYYSAKK